MTVKSFGTGVSGYINPEGRNYETNVVMAGKYVLDVEQNLAQDIAGVRKVAPGVPSGWLCPDFLSTDSPTQALFTSSPAANTILFPALTAVVNGWTLQVTNTGVVTDNQVVLPVPPTSVGGKRYDLVVLEVWRRVLTATGTSTATAGKSAGGRIWREGNVKVANGDDAALNYADDILNPTVAQETSKRVQIQYRLRVIGGVDITSYPRVMNDPTLVANSVPASAGAPDGVATVFTYTLLSSPGGSPGDPGLWRAGDGDPTNTLGTVDGYVYSIPLMVVSRRNTQAFDRNTNHNGGSGRPDSRTATAIVPADLVDLRTGVSPSGWNYQELGEKNFSFLLDNTLRSEVGATSIGGGVQGATLLTAVEVGLTNSNGGNGTTTGDTPGADFIGQFDGVRSRFSDRPVMETCWVKIAPPGAWDSYGTVVINPTSLPVYRHPAISWSSFVPAGTIILDVLDAFTSNHTAGGQDEHLTYGVTGLGANPAGAITLTFTAFVGNTNADMFVKLVVLYPPGQGLTQTPSSFYPPTFNNPVALPADYNTMLTAGSGYVDAAHRELTVEYQTTNVTETLSYPYQTVIPYELYPEPLWGGLGTGMVIPEKMDTLVSCTVNGVARADAVIGQSPYHLMFTGMPVVSGGQTVVVTYKARRPIQQTGAQLTMYYEAAAPQTVRTAVLGTTLTLDIKWVSPHLYCMSGGTGSDTESYPYPCQTAQTGGVYPGSAGSYSGDHLMRTSIVSAGGFSASSGFCRVPAMIPLACTPSGLVMTRVTGDVDVEGRSYFKAVTGYQPGIFGPPLAHATPHRVVVPAIAELTADSNLGSKGQLFLVTFQRWAVADSASSVAFDTTLSQNQSSVSVYRLKGNLLNNRQGV